MAYRGLIHRKMKQGEGSTSRDPVPSELDEDELVATVERVLREALATNNAVDVVIEHGIYKDVWEIGFPTSDSLLPDSEYQSG